MSPASVIKECVISVSSYIVFLFLDFLEIIFCIIYKFLDELFEGKSCSCYCENKGEINGNVNEMSETLFNRRNLFRKMGFLSLARKWENFVNYFSKLIFGSGEKIVKSSNKWSDCGCESCVSWMKNDQNLHFVVKDPSSDSCENVPENVIFVHGFLSSSAFWTETVFPNLSDSASRNYRLFAVDLLGFGKSPKPNNCFYTISDHLEMIEKSVIDPFKLESFHVVAHSMGCIIALALAAKYSNCVKSVTLIAPPYVPNSNKDASLTALQKLAGKKLWPPLLFGSAFMSWYEHLGRCVCLIICRNHRIWEKILKLITWKRDLHFLIVDFTKHTHHSAWHTMHNVVCGGAKQMDEYLEKLKKCGVKISVVHGEGDKVVSMECSCNIKSKVNNAEVNIVPNVDHVSVIIGREKVFTRNLELFWRS